MSVKMTKGNPGATTEGLADLLSRPGVARHSDRIDFMRRHDGAIPEVNEFDVGLDNGSGVQKFYSAAEVREALRNLSDRMPPDLMPIADAEGGNFVCLGLSAGRSGVFFWDHEIERESSVAESFIEFLQRLRRFDPDSVQLKPGQVISA